MSLSPIKPLLIMFLKSTFSFLAFALGLANGVTENQILNIGDSPDAHVTISQVEWPISRQNAANFELEAIDPQYPFSLRSYSKKETKGVDLFVMEYDKTYELYSSYQDVKSALEYTRDGLFLAFLLKEEPTYSELPYTFTLYYCPDGYMSQVQVVIAYSLGKKDGKKDMITPLFQANSDLYFNPLSYSPQHIRFSLMLADETDSLFMVQTDTLTIKFLNQGIPSVSPEVQACRDARTLDLLNYYSERRLLEWAILKKQIGGDNFNINILEYNKYDVYPLANLTDRYAALVEMIEEHDAYDCEEKNED